MNTSAENSQDNHQHGATQATTPQKRATVSLGNKSLTIEGRAAGLVNGLAFAASVVLAALFVVDALKSQRER